MNNFMRRLLFALPILLVSFSLIFASNEISNKEYLQYLINHYPKILRNLKTPISQNVLKNLKIAMDLKKYFGDLRQFHIIEIGNGSKGLYKVLRETCGFASYTIVNDRNICLNSPLQCDLVISDHFFAEAQREDQIKYIKHIFTHASNGYITFKNSPILALNSLSITEVISQLYKIEKSGILEEEIPLIESSGFKVKWRSLQKLNIYKKPKQPLRLKFDSSLQKCNAITYGLSGGRLGDNLMAYLHAKWISYKYSLPLLMVSFPYSDSFQFHYEEYKAEEFNFQHKILTTSKNDLKNINRKNSTIFQIPYFSENYFEFMNEKSTNKLYFLVDWEDPFFNEEIRHSLTLIKPPVTLNLPTDKITVAVHVRRGGGFDKENLKLCFPLKAPPDSYYIHEIKRLAELFENQKLYVFIFTDDLNPISIVHNFQDAIQNSNIEFDCRCHGNNHFSNVLEDFFLWENLIVVLDRVQIFLRSYQNALNIE